MKSIKSLIVYFLCIVYGANAQEPFTKISGQIIDNQGNLIGASIKIKGTNISGLSNNKGAFNLQATPGSYTLLVQYIGYETIEIPLQIKTSKDISLGKILLSEKNTQLDAIVVTGQFGPQSIRNSVYQVRTITNEQIRLRGATNIQSVLSTELGMRFSNDLTLGTTDVQLMGMSGQNVKILLDGVPMVDRGSTRESLGQIDVNIIERIEIVEGPMSVTYGSDALAGVINIITKKAESGANWTLNARIQEETAGDEYQAFNGEGTHNEFLGLAWQKNSWQFSGNFTRNFFGGWQGSLLERKKEWMPKEQYLSTAGVAYRTKKLNTWYRFNGTTETLKSLGDTYVSAQTNNLSATDQFYITYRWFHQLQAEYQFNTNTSINVAASFTDYSRQTQTTDIDLFRERRTINLSGSQDESIFKTTFVRFTAQQKLSKGISLQHGFETNLNASTGQRILGSPTIKEFAYFVSSEFKIGSKINLRPGLRFLKNSVYDAPPAIPSINTKFILIDRLDLRLAYARGFRSPALRELYFTFFDSSHSIRGNTELKAENSDSFNAFLSYQILDKTSLRVNTTLGGFYNNFNNLISIGTDSADPTISTYLNVDTYKTTGFTLNNTFFWKNFQGSLGISHIGRYNRFSEIATLPDFVWSDEINTNLRYSFPKSATSISFFYKYTGQQPSYQVSTMESGLLTKLAEMSAFHTADLTANKIFFKNYTMSGGVKNIFDVKRIQNSAVSSGGSHATSGAVPMSYGRSFFLGLTAQLSK
ncbi:MAG TPA: TonB-dependent receptor [Leadbetterella sp.]|nr:TonB-dependent receptor [Leadbetterella sp.]